MGRENEKLLRVSRIFPKTRKYLNEIAEGRESIKRNCHPYIFRRAIETTAYGKFRARWFLDSLWNPDYVFVNCGNGENCQIRIVESFSFSVGLKGHRAKRIPLKVLKRNQFNGAHFWKVESNMHAIVTTLQIKNIIVQIMKS